ncbi:hypothetical protein [Verrucomicrobium spinosum]|uniref:hypothetical protein n=1 Tax=Verrucomicrobium spinosum TaxID=2736 RepID=UPI00017463E9|nr:hypothetical protein [Verrucomicrobium spinosum]
MPRPPHEPIPLADELRQNRVSLYWGTFRLRVDVDIAAANNLPPAGELTWDQALAVLRAQYARAVEEFEQVTTANREAKEALKP